MSLPRGHQQEEEEPDASSIKPVSSLLARFETLNAAKASDTAPLRVKTHLPSQSSSLDRPVSRPISPRPKPDRLRDFKTSNDVRLPTSAAAPPTPQTPKAPGIPIEPGHRPNLPTASTDAHEHQAPVLKPKPIAKPQLIALPPPAVRVEPPQSPPKSSVPSLLKDERSPNLNVVTTIAEQTSLHSDRTGRPATPNPPPPRSPKLASSRPPSPPPPRRSGELRRDDRPKQQQQQQQPPPPPPPPPAGRSERLRPQSPKSVVKPGFPERRSDISEENSPFSSPPSSPEVVEDETPPELPTRPRPAVESAPTGFERPPVHHSVAERKMERAIPDVRAKGGTRSQDIEEPPPALPARPRSTDPVRMHRPEGNTNSPYHHSQTSSVSQSKRVASNPSHQLSSITNPRTYERSNATNRAVAQSPIDIRPNTALPRSPQASTPLSSSPSRTEPAFLTSSFPDSSSANRRPPYIRKGTFEFQPKYDARIFDVCGNRLCTSGQLTRVWRISDGELLMTIPHNEGVKATAVTFKPGLTVDEEARRVWIGTNGGDLMEVDIESKSIVEGKANVHGRLEVIHIHRRYNELWSLDEGGTLHVWGPGEEGLPNMGRSPSQTFKTPRGHTFSMVIGDELWYATGKEIRVFLPTLDARSQFQVLLRPLVAEGAGEVTSGTQMRTEPGKVFFGHSDGKVSIFSTKDYTCLSVLSVSSWKINAITGAGQYIWVASGMGMMSIYEIGQEPWVVLKEWKAHESPVLRLRTDCASSYRLGQVQVVSLAADNRVKVWDGLLEDDWMEDEMKSKDTAYCEFDEIRALVFTWNAGAKSPNSLRSSGDEEFFFQDLLRSSDLPDILIFGFQELVDLEDKTATAKRLFKGSRSREGGEQERMSHQHREWRDFLMRTLDDQVPDGDLYHLLHSAPLVGLFSCIFVRSSLRARIRKLDASEVKRGMGGVYGNKGAVAIRFMIDDSSLCFVNCHLAAGQTQAQSRHNDVAAILEASLFPAERNTDCRINNFAGGGDGSLVLDHELCILNGDLNYRIDTMSRDTVVGAVKQNNLQKLLERDQLLVARRRNPAFKLRAFEELPITFAPTYKYDVQSDRYDTSEKRRSPAWCDRILFRGRGRVQQLDYARHEVRVSDHRPVTGNFRLWVKKIDSQKRADSWLETQRSFDDVRVQELINEKLHYLTTVCGYEENVAQQLIRSKTTK